MSTKLLFTLKYFKFPLFSLLIQSAMIYLSQQAVGNDCHITSNIHTAVSAVFVLDIVSVRRCIGCSSFCYLMTQNVVIRYHKLKNKDDLCGHPCIHLMYLPHVPLLLNRIAGMFTKSHLDAVITTKSWRFHFR